MIRKKTYELPTLTDGSVTTCSLTSKEIRAILSETVDDRTTEMRPQAALQLRRLRPLKKKPRSELICSGFKVRTTFPDNIVLLEDGGIFVVVDIESCTEFTFVLTGHRFTQQELIDADRSAHYYRVWWPSSLAERVSTRRVRGKCYVVPLVNDVAEHRKKVHELDPLLCWDMKYCVSMLM